MTTRVVFRGAAREVTNTPRSTVYICRRDPFVFAVVLLRVLRINSHGQTCTRCKCVLTRAIFVAFSFFFETLEPMPASQPGSAVVACSLGFSSQASTLYLSHHVSPFLSFFGGHSHPHGQGWLLSQCRPGSLGWRRSGAIHRNRARARPRAVCVCSACAYLCMCHSSAQRNPASAGHSYACRFFVSLLLFRPESK